MTHEEEVMQVWEELRECVANYDLDGVEIFVERLRELELEE